MNVSTLISELSKYPEDFKVCLRINKMKNNILENEDFYIKGVFGVGHPAKVVQLSAVKKS
jgi:hypothetical protein